jgi:Eukaryotic translation initiation factor 3 subunit 7 (eIF-3)
MDFFSSPCFAKSIEELEVNHNPDGWGPVSGTQVAAFSDVPYAHFDKKDKCHRVADFTQGAYGQQYQKPYQRYRRDEQGNVDFTYKHDAAEDSTFQLVDTSKSQTKCRLICCRIYL